MRAGAGLALVLCACEAASPPPGPPVAETPPPEAPGQRRGLLVAVGAYPPRSGWTKLDGPPNDIALLEPRLRRLGFELSTLCDNGTTQDGRSCDGPATRAEITRRFREELAKLGPSDVGLFFFAGHGGRIEDTNGDEEDGFDETLVPFDVSEAGEIIDDEIGAWIAESTTGQLVFLLDSCHSGTAHRDGAGRGVRTGPSRAPPSKEISALVQLELRQPGRTMVVLTAAKAGESARELPPPLWDDAVGKGTVGVFTEAFASVLDAGLPSSWQAVRDRISARLAARGIRDQTPTLEATDARLAPFRFQAGAASTGLLLGACRSKAPPCAGAVNVGKLHGVWPGSRLALDEHEATVTEATAHCACVEGMKGELRAGVRARRILAPGDIPTGQIRGDPQRAERALARRRAERILMLEGGGWLDLRVAGRLETGAVAVTATVPFELELRVRDQARAEVVIIEIDEDDRIRILRPRPESGRTSLEVSSGRWVRVPGRFRMKDERPVRLRAVAVHGGEGLDLRPLADETFRSGPSSPLTELLGIGSGSRTQAVEPPAWAAATLVLERHGARP